MEKEISYQEQRIFEIPTRISASYKEHRVFKTPPRTRIVWKYMSFAKFVWLIAKESLYFSRLDQHDDEWEGWLPNNWSIQNKMYARFSNYINCWHMNDNESDAMWKLYGNPVGDTVAIRTTVGRLIKSLGKAGGIEVYIGKINYKEPDRPADNLYWPVIYKRKPFQHEKELRLCVHPSSDNPPSLTELKQALANLGIDHWHGVVDTLKKSGNKGIQVPVDLTQLIQKVVLCPNSEEWLFDSVRHIIKDKISHKRIVKSEMRSRVEQGLRER